MSVLSSVVDAHGAAAPTRVDPRDNRAGKVWRALSSIWSRNPDDTHPTLPQIAAEAGISVSTARRGVHDLDEAEMVKVEADPCHPVGRRITPLATPIRSGTPTSSDTAKADTPYVIQREGINSLHVNEGGARSDTPPSTSLSKLFGRLDNDPEAGPMAFTRMVADYGPGFEDFYSRLIADVSGGRFPVGEVILAIDYADGPRIGHKGKAFINSIKRRRKFPARAANQPPSEAALPPDPAHEEAKLEPPITTSPAPAATPERTEDSELRARWDALPEPDRVAIRHQVGLAYPGIRWPAMLEPLYLEAMASPYSFVNLAASTQGTNPNAPPPQPKHPSGPRQEDPRFARRRHGPHHGDPRPGHAPG